MRLIVICADLRPAQQLPHRARHVASGRNPMSEICHFSEIREINRETSERDHNVADLMQKYGQRPHQGNHPCHGDTHS